MMRVKVLCPKAKKNGFVILKRNKRMKNVQGGAKMGRRRQEGCENGDGGEKKRSRTGLRSHKVDNFSELEWERGKGKRGGRVRVSLSSGKKPQGEPENVGSSEATAQTTQFLVFHRRTAFVTEPLKNFELRNCENERIEHDEREETGERQKEGREEEMEVQTVDQLPAQQPVEKCSIRQVSRVEETGGQREIIREEEEVQAIEEQPSPPPAEQCSIGHAWSEEEVGALNKGLGSEVDVQIIEVKQSQSSVAAGSRRSIQALGFLESYLGEHQQSLASTNEASIPNLYEVAQAKAKIQRISTLSIDEVMESECVQSFKSSLEFLLKSDDTAGAQSANIEHVLGKLALLEFKYSTASKITDEVNEVSKRKLELEQEVKYYTICSSEAQKEEYELLNQINGKKLMIEDLKEKLAAAEACLKELEQSHATQTTKLSEFNSGREKVQRLLSNHCIHENTSLKKALQAKKNFLSVEATWVQMQQLLTLICSWKEEAATP